MIIRGILFLGFTTRRWGTDTKCNTTSLFCTGFLQKTAIFHCITPFSSDSKVSSVLIGDCLADQSQPLSYHRIKSRDVSYQCPQIAHKSQFSYTYKLHGILTVDYDGKGRHTKPYCRLDVYSHVRLYN